MGHFYHAESSGVNPVRWMGVGAGNSVDKWAKI